MKKVLLLNPNTYDNPYTVFPLGLAYIDDALKKAGHQTHWLDLNLDSEEQQEAFLEDQSFEYIAISLRNIDDVRIHVREFFVDKIRDLIRRIREKSNAIIVLGGSGFSILPQTIFNYCEPDFGVAGEGENAIVSLLSGEPYERINGLLWRNEDGVLRYVPTLRIPDSPEDGPTRNTRILEYYLRDGGMANVQTQRGCPLKCCYCTYPLIEGKRYRRRSGKAIAQEFIDLKEQGAKYAFIVDSVFNTSANHLKEVCEALIEAGKPLPWGCFMRPKGLSRELLQLAKDAGLEHVEFGSDSLSDSVLDAYQKGFTFSEIKENSLLCKEVGIDFCHFIIFGGPGETEATMQEAFENSKEIPGALFFPSVGMRVYPDTRLKEVSELDFPASSEEGCAWSGEASHLLRPSYYIAPGLTIESIEAKITEFCAQLSNWVDLDNTNEFDMIAKRLRQKGVVGPLWNYLSVMRRLK